MNTLTSSCWLLPILTLSVGLICIGLGLFVYMKSTQDSKSKDSREREVNLEISKSEFKYQGGIGGLLILSGVLIIVLSIRYIVIMDCDKRKPNANVSINVNANTEIQINLVQLQQKLDRGVNEPEYEINRYPNREVVQGKVGRYYVIDLKDADDKILILFSLGKYTKDEFDRLFRKSMSKVNQDILRQLDAGKVSYNIYVRGSADILGENKLSIGTLIEGESRQITCLVENPNNPNQYLPEPHAQVIPRNFANKHLPNLRASYIQDRLKDLDISSTILNGSVTRKPDGQDRNALIFLYWPGS